MKLLAEQRDFVGNVRIAVNGSADDVSDLFDSIKWQIRTIEEEEA